MADRKTRTYHAAMRTLSAIVILVLLASSLSAQQWKDDGATMEKVADGVYAIIHQDATDAWPHGNTGVIIGGNDVLVIDSTYLPSRARADIELIRKVTTRPVRYLVMTHWHFDHNNGNQVYRDAFPGISIISERNTRDYIDLNSTWWPKMSNAPDSDRRASLARLETELSTGKDADGKEITAERKKELPKYIAQRKSELAELAAMQVVPPNVLFDGTMTLILGNRRVELRDVGKANSPHDVTIYLPEERVLFTGDILVQAPTPYVGASWPVPWIDVLRELESLPVNAIVPGHGPVMKDHSYIRQVRSLLEAATTKVEAMARQGMTLAQIQAGIDLLEQRRSFKGWADLDDATWKQVMDVLVERAWRGVRGQG
jgi:glyoxylase-like metal-dependent hydrolase (beta-lactamase superfamily II)